MAPVDDEALAEIAQRLYGLRPEEFTGARDDEVKRARADGDRAGAKAIAALRRPSLAAWLVNALVRERGDQVEQLLELGAALGAAQRGLAGDEVRALGRQRQQLLAAVGRQARALARELGHPVSDDVGQEVEQTLGAAMVDPRVAEAVRSGRLTSSTSYAGLGLPEEAEPASPPRRHLSAVPATGPAAGERTPSQPDAAAPAAPAPRGAGRRARPGGDPANARRAEEERREQARQAEEERRERARRAEEERRAAELDQARQEEREAHEALTAALDASRAAQGRLDDAEHDAAEARRRIDDLQEQLRRAEADLVAAVKDERTLRRERDAAARVTDLAERAARRARERVERLDGSD
jgi:hypothetical protein